MTNKIFVFKMAAAAIVFAFAGLCTVCRSSMAVAIVPTKMGHHTDTRATREPIQPIPHEVILNGPKVALGEKLFSETLLSHNNTISCTTCHSLNTGGTDRSVRSSGIDDQQGRVNTPTVFNATYNFKQFWDGRSESLEDQINGPTHAADEMGSNWNEIIGKLNASPEYVTAFPPIYRDGITAENIRDAIATFERSLITPNSRFDQFLEGDQNALTSSEQEGYRIFKSVGCSSCHQGMNVGGNLFQEFGVMGDYFKDRGNITEADRGRYNVSHNNDDMHVFKVPSLRNVDLTPPYFHDGSAKTLNDAVLVMSKYQLGKQLSQNEISLVVQFLECLTGEYKKYGE